mmetsp:Transcript_18007/g.25446  ORF Transcript_18007/g.25446 Transcript_18007/m.25446 type:complete len:579 (+) Transcript_18007:151-1887(+)
MSQFNELNNTSSLLPYTPEEQYLFDLYETVKRYEKDAARAISRKAQARISAAHEKYEEEMRQQGATIGRDEENDEEQDFDMESKNENAMEDEMGTDTVRSSTSVVKQKGRKRKREKVEGSDGEPNSSESLEDDSDREDEEKQREKDENAKARRERKIARLREETDRARQKAMLEEEEARKEEELRRKLLGPDGDGNGDDNQMDDMYDNEKQTMEDMVKSVSIRKRPTDSGDNGRNQGPSLIDNLDVSTPPHDFSKKLGMNRASITGRVLFPESGPATDGWCPPVNASFSEEGCLELSLPDFDSSLVDMGQGNNTLGIRFSAPQESKRFSINIAAPDHQNYHSVLFHFNPRQHQRGGQLVINDKKEGTWGQGINIPLSTLPLMFGQKACTLIFQINRDGFDVFIEGKHCARLEHRSPLPSKKCSLQLQFPSTDDYNNPENWIVYKVWWGHKEIMGKGDLSVVAGVNTFDALHPRKLFVSGLAKIFTEQEVDLRRAELERAFKKYGGAQGAVVVVPTNSTFAFVELETDRQASQALTEMAGRYTLSRARRSKHEALLEKRAMAEFSVSDGSNIKGSTDWD